GSTASRQSPTSRAPGAASTGSPTRSLDRSSATRRGRWRGRLGAPRGVAKATRTSPSGRVRSAWYGISNDGDVTVPPSWGDGGSLRLVAGRKSHSWMAYSDTAVLATAL